MKQVNGIYKPEKSVGESSRLKVPTPVLDELWEGLLTKHERCWGRVVSTSMFPLIDRGDRVLVEKVNFIKRHSRPSAQTRQGGIIQKEAPLHVSNVLLVCPKCNKGTRMGKKVLEGGGKALVCKACGEQIERK